MSDKLFLASPQPLPPAKRHARPHARASTTENFAGLQTTRPPGAPDHPLSILHLQSTAGNKAVTGLLERDCSPSGGKLSVQRNARSDIDDAETNRDHIDTETYPGITQDLDTVITSIDGKITTYEAAHGGVPPAPVTPLGQSASGLKTFSERLIESADGAWTEVGEMARLSLKGRIPIPARSTQTDADIEYRKQGVRTGIEAKAVNSANPGQVTAVLNAANAQLGTRPNIGWNKIVVWIAHEQNQWPGVVGFNNRSTDAQVCLDVKTKLDGMNLANVDRMRLQMVRVPAGHPDNALTLKATKTPHHGWMVTVAQRY